MNPFEKVFAVTEKELTLAFRFKLLPIVSSFFTPLSKIVPILLIYYGFLHFSNAGSFGEITKENYVLFLSLGMFLFTIFEAGISSFGSRFNLEKFWKTIDAIFIAPVSIIELIIGVGLAEFVIGLPTIAVFLIAAFSVMPLSAINFIIIFFVVFLVYLICLSGGLVHGSLTLTREGYAFVVSYFFMAWNFFSCFVYPISIVPTDFLGFLNLKAIAFYNPVYQGLSFVTELWSKGEFSTFAFFYVLAFAITMPFAAAFFFKKSWQKLGIEGY